MIFSNLIRAIMSTYQVKKSQPKYLNYCSTNYTNECTNFYNKHIKGKYINPILTLDQIDFSIPYVNKKKIERSNLLTNIQASCHIGQRKLLISEVQFLTNYIHDLNQNVFVIYAGSAPCEKFFMLHSMFPNVKFLLVDPNEFMISVNDSNHYSYPDTFTYLSYSDSFNKEYKIDRRNINYFDGENLFNLEKLEDKLEGCRKATKKSFEYIFSSNKQIFICEEYFTTEMSEILSQVIPSDYRFLFISDIRTCGGNEPTDIDIIHNNALTYACLDILKPDVSMIKFRLPYFNPGGKSEFDEYMMPDIYESAKRGCDFLSSVKIRKNMPMFRCDKIFLQAWKGPSSTEGRGIIHKNDIIKRNIILYNSEKIEGYFAAYNNVIRHCPFYKNHYVADGYDHCNDCAIEISTWTNYIQKFQIDVSVKNLIDMSNGLTKKVNSIKCHGRAFL